MDDMNPPEDFEAHNTENKIFVCGHLNVSIRTLMGSEMLNDRGKKEWLQREDLKWLLTAKKEYIGCYYLHLAVDDICENKDRIKGDKETIEN
jgi:2-methylcitrate dehydratase PrpD